jgi:hypothetical protein
LPGSIWGEGGKYKPVRNREHQRNAFKYIRDDQAVGAWVWTFNGSSEKEKRARRKAKER